MPQERPKKWQKKKKERKEAGEKGKRAGEEALPPGSGGLPFYPPRGVGGGKDHLFLFLQVVAPPWHPVRPYKVR